MCVEVHKIYPIGREESGDVLCVELQSQGYANWFRWYADFDYDDDGYHIDDRPTLVDIPLIESGWDDHQQSEERRVEDSEAAPAAA